MLKRVPMIRGAAVHPLCVFLEQAGVDTARLLTSVGISPSFAGTEKPRMEALPYQSFSEFLVLAERASKIKDFGLKAGATASMNDMGEFGNRLKQCFTVYELVQTAVRLTPLITSGTWTWLEPGRETGSLRLCHRQMVKTAHAQIEGFAIQLHIDAVRLGAGSDWRPNWIALNSKAGNHASNESLCEADVDSDVDYLAFEIPRSILSREMPAARLPEDENQIERRLRDSAPATDLPGALSTAIRAGFSARIPTVEQASEIAGTNRRTLHRRLQQHGLTFKLLVERTRTHEAFSLLKMGNLSSAEIAYHLGYSDPANFTHAFRRWTGQTPSAYRRGLTTPSSA